jgi:hypothetical protein
MTWWQIALMIWAACGIIPSLAFQLIFGGYMYSAKSPWYMRLDIYAFIWIIFWCGCMGPLAGIVTIIHFQEEMR